MKELFEKLSEKINDLGLDNIPAIRKKRKEEALFLLAEILIEFSNHASDEFVVEEFREDDDV